MNRLLESVLKKDDSATVVLLDDRQNSYEITTELCLAPEPGPTLAEQLMDPSLLEHEAKSRPVRVPVRVIRTVLAYHAGFSALVMTMSYLAYYILSFDSSSSIIVFVLISSSTAVAIFYGSIVTLYMLRGLVNSWVLPCLSIGLVLVTILMAGAMAAVTGTIVPIQAATMCFAQCTVVFAVSLDHPTGVDPLYCALYMLIAGIFVWFLGLYGFIVQRAWISSGFLLVFGAASAAYTALQIRYSDRFSVSDADTARALLHFYLDPVLWLFKQNQI
jgi:hypothetical protein